MAAETTSTTLNDVIPAISIPDFVQGHRYAPSIAGAVAWVENVPPGTGPVFVWPRFDSMTPNAGTKTESTGSWSNVAVATSSESFTSGVVGMMIDISKEAIYDAKGNFPSSALAEAERSMRNRLESDLLAVIPNSTLTVGTDVDDYDLGHIATALATWDTTNPPEGELAIILAPDQLRDVRADIVTNAAPAAALVAGANDIFRGVAGYVGRIFGAALFVTSNVPASGTGWGGCITQMGQGKSGLGVAVWNPIQAELVPTGGTNFVERYVLTTRYAVGLTHDAAAPAANLVEIISRT